MEANILLMMKKIGKKRLHQYQLVIVDLENSEVMYETKTLNIELFGRL